MFISLICFLTVIRSDFQKEASKSSLITLSEVSDYLLEGPFLSHLHPDDKQGLNNLSAKIVQLMNCPTELLEDGMINAMERTGYDVRLEDLELNLRAINRLIFDLPPNLLFPWKLQGKVLVLGTYSSFRVGPPTRAITEFRMYKKVYKRRKATDGLSYRI